MRAINFLKVFKFVSTVNLFLSLSFLIPAVYSLAAGDGQFLNFIYPLILSASIFLISIQIKAEDVNLKEAIVSVCLIWLLFPALSALSYFMGGSIPSFVDAYFESVSGFTTTGASILTDIEHLPKSVLLWRSTTHWIGGLGFVVFSLSLLPVLGSGGMQLMRFEASKAFEEKIKPRVKEVARATFTVYLIISLAEIVLLKLSGLNLYESVNHTFATVATGGFSTKNRSVGAFNNPAAEMVIALFMFLGSVNLQLYYRAFRARSIRYLFSYYEVKSHLIIIFSSIAFATSVLFLTGTYGNLLQALRFGIFQVVTAATTTGFASTDYTNWPSSVLALIMVLSLIGASSSSTGGGLKQFRFIVMLKTMYNELRKTSHPQLVYRVTLGKKVLDISMINALWAYVSLYFGTTVVVGFILTVSGHDLITAFSASVACITSLGPGLAKVGPAANFSFLHGWEKLLLSFEMVLGRLELLTVFSIFIPSFWRE